MSAPSNAPRLQTKNLAARYVSGPVARVLVALHVSANAITLAGTAVVMASAYFAADGRFLIAGLVFLAGSTMDLFDGPVARLTGEANRLGAFLDSLMDRVGEGALLFGLLVFHVRTGHELGAYLAFSAAVISMLVSYSRARAEALGIEGDVGILGRPERVVVLTVGLLAGYPVPALGLIVAAGSFTVLQRFAHVWRSAR